MSAVTARFAGGKTLSLDEFDDALNDSLDQERDIGGGLMGIMKLSFKKIAD